LDSTLRITSNFIEQFLFQIALRFAERHRALVWYNQPHGAAFQLLVCFTLSFSRCWRSFSSL